MEVGTRVKYTASYLVRYRDMWQGCGNSMKSVYKKQYDEKVAARGKIIQKLDSGYEILWDDLSKSETISYYVEQA